jgi:hypothetical protein
MEGRLEVVVRVVVVLVVAVEVVEVADRWKPRSSNIGMKK